MELLQGFDSKFRFIVVAAKRARQLIGGAKARVQSEGQKVTGIAQRELFAGLVPFMMTDDNDHDLDKAATLRLCDHQTHSGMHGLPRTLLPANSRS